MQRVAVSEIVMIGCPNFFFAFTVLYVNSDIFKSRKFTILPRVRFLSCTSKQKQKQKKTMMVKIKYFLLTEERLTTKFFLEKGSLVLKGQ